MKLLTIVVIAALATVSFACGGDDPAPSNAAATLSRDADATVLEFEADPTGRLAYTSRRETVAAGEITLTFKNPQGLPHDVGIEDSKGELVAETPLITRDTSTIITNLQPGMYIFYSTVAGERQKGMKGVLIVE